MERCDVAVVGGGPAGSMAARTAARAGCRVVVVERSPNRPARCTGLVGPDAMAMLQPPDRVIAGVIRGLRVCAPDGARVDIDSPEVKGFVLDRNELDRQLLDQAAEAGAMIRPGVAAVGLEGRTLRTSSGRIGYEVLIGADGAQSGVRRWAGLPPPEGIAVGTQAVVAARVADHAVEIHLGSSVAPGFFAWVVPREDGAVLAGLLTTHASEAASLLGRFLLTRFPGRRAHARVSGLVPIGPPPCTAGDGVLLVGDAAAHVKPLSGGGILFGAIAGRVAGQIAARGSPSPATYESAWRAAIGSEIAFGLRARKRFLGLSDQEISQILPLLGSPHLRDLVIKRGNIDRPSELLRAALTSPRAWGAVRPLAQALGGWDRLRRIVFGPD